MRERRINDKIRKKWDECLILSWMDPFPRQVVKTDDRRVARECGVSAFPSLVYFRRNKPILFDGDFRDSEVVLRWLRAHDEVATWLVLRKCSAGNTVVGRSKR